MRILLTGGGTAGHVNPALAIAATIQAHQPEAECLFISSDLPGDKAQDLVRRAGYELETVHIRGLRRPVFHPANLTLPLVMQKARRAARQLIGQFRPTLIIGTGGYACWPVVSEGAALGLPTAVHESNALPGRAICQVKHRVDRIFINFPETAGRLGMEGDPRVIRVGNPHLDGFDTVNREEARRTLGLAPEEIYVLAFGGSLGAEHVNDGLVSLADTVARSCPGTVLCLATGKRDFQRTRENLHRTGADACPRIQLTDYVYDMPVRMAAADLVISRAGAMTVSELALTGKAAVLVPSPYVADNHQYRNAMALVDAGAGVCVEEKDIPGGGLIRAVQPLLGDRAARERMGRKIRAGFACPEANESIYRELMKLCQD
jgi:UDP-N-acetylglucosamine--N-acetylmuramyl-(pentapeptide) pyrophosphoryl-undecaprenol N-acetylglucosamine transferase